MKHYELLYIIPSRYTDGEIETIVSKINDLAKKHGGEITLTDNLGNVKLAYPIKKMLTGSYVVIEFNAEPGKIKELEEALKLIPEVLRFQIVNKKIKTQAEIEEERAWQKKITQKAEAGKAGPTPKVSLEELDKKLGEILDGDII